LPVSAFSIPNTQKENMNDKNAQRVHLETFEDFDNGLSDLIDLWSQRGGHDESQKTTRKR
jgi:hypothetical protein